MAATDVEAREIAVHDADAVDLLAAADPDSVALLADPQRLLRLVAIRAAAEVDADLGAVVLGVAKGTLGIEVAGGTDAEMLEGRRFPWDGSISGSVLANDSPVVVAELSIDRRNRWPWTSRFGPAAFLPFPTSGAPPAVLVVARERSGGPFSLEDLDRLGDFLAACPAVLFWRAQEEARELALLRDRERIAKELHDTAVQRLFAASMSLQAVTVLGDPRAQRERVDVAVGQLDRVIVDIRSAVFALGPRP